MNVCIIPARGGSKRIPKKNMREFCGKPMIAHSILAARRSGVFDRILVSTDSEDIAEVARAWGGEVPFMRPEELSDDHASTDAVLLHALQWLAQQDDDVEYACCLYATAPFVQPDFLVQGLKLLEASDSVSAFSVTSFPFPIFRGLKVNEMGHLEMLWPEHRLTRSQDLQETYHDAGQFYWVHVGRYMTLPAIYADDALPVILPRYLVQDIDTEEDWARAELMFQTLEETD